ncbi:hypothetical protein NDU88_007299 [Pleurodeles waltl]|uniref:Uncharacterized protein n=1 Tax=Pleurodeles waltl TaxID=8319 RepID=A0AAV7P0G4_PLEWA|nr:hypothetical protein NDU88_007299 [Pleurodeles waltl]
MATCAAWPRLLPLGAADPGYIKEPLRSRHRTAATEAYEAWWKRVWTPWGLDLLVLLPPRLPVSTAAAVSSWGLAAIAFLCPPRGPCEGVKCALCK